MPPFNAILRWRSEAGCDDNEQTPPAAANFQRQQVVRVPSRRVPPSATKHAFVIGYPASNRLSYSVDRFGRVPALQRPRGNARDRREAVVADLGLGRLNWAVNGPTAVDAGRDGVRAEAIVPREVAFTDRSGGGSVTTPLGCPEMMPCYHYLSVQFI